MRSAPRTTITTSALEAEVDACLAALPVVARHLEETRAQVEQAVVEVCASFQGIAARASSSVAEARSVLGSDASAQGKAGLDSTLEATRATFDRLLVRMGESLTRAQDAGEQIRRVTRAVGKIETVLAEVEDIALSTRLLTINAKVQASHAGTHGRGFVVIAEAISELSGKSDAIVAEVRGNLAEVVGAVQGAAGDLERLSGGGEEAVKESQVEIHGALDLVARVHGETQAGLQRATEAGDELAREVNRAVTALQFQDRVSQRMEHLIRAVAEMSDALGAQRAGTGGEVRDHLGALERSYTMAEEHAAPAQGAGADDVVLF